MKTKCIFLILLFQLHHCIGQEVEKEVPYFVMACIEEFGYGEPYRWDQFPFYYKILYKLDKDQLITIDTLNAENNQSIIMNNILQCDNKKLFYFEESEMLNQDTRKYYSFFDYSNGFKFRRFDLEADSSFKNSIAGPTILLIDSVIIIEDENDNDTYYGRDKYFNRYVLPGSLYVNTYSDGKSGMDRSHSSYSVYRSMKTFKNKLVLARDSTTISLFQLPDSLLNNSLYYYCFLNNNNYIVYQPVDYSSKEDLFTCIAEIVDKKTKLCHVVELPTSMQRIKNWNIWFYGSTILPQPDKPRIISGKTQPEKYASRYDNTYGDAADLLLFTGQLYLYNFSTEKIIKWNTGDPDSEIITIHEGTIYYRVFDEIRTVELDTIKNEINWPSQKLLIKDKKRVPNIHWMFFAPKQDKVEEVWVNRPKN